MPAAAGRPCRSLAASLALALLWHLLLVPAAAQVAAAAQQQQSAEVQALIQIRDGFENGLELLPDWNRSAASPCPFVDSRTWWSHVTCNAPGGSVVAL